jgi:hypothetical protein
VYIREKNYLMLKINEKREVCTFKMDIYLISLDF